MASLDWQASIQDQSQLRLQVTAPEPDVSAEAVNSWAGVMVSRLNNLYGTGEQTLTTLESEVQIAKEEWNTAQQALEDYLPQSRVEVLEVQLSEQMNQLARYLRRIEFNQDLIKDLQGLMAQLDSLDDNQKLSTGRALSIIALQQRAAGGISGAQFQIQGGEILGADYTVDDGLTEIASLTSALQDQNEALRQELTKIEDTISDFSVELESEKFEVEQLRQERDLARTSYTALANQLEETKITQA